MGRHSTRLHRLPDHLPPDARVLFVGINPGIRSARIGHHFAGYSNRFWKLLFESKLVPESITCHDDGRLPEWGYGLTNLIPRASAGINDLRPKEYEAGHAALVEKIRRARPRVVALVGLTLYRRLFPSARGRLRPGPTGETLAGVPVFLLPNPSGRNANFTYREMLAAFRALRRHLRRLEAAPKSRENVKSGGK